MIDKEKSIEGCEKVWGGGMTKGGFSVNTGSHLLLAPINGRLFGCSDRNLFSSQNTTYPQRMGLSAIGHEKSRSTTISIPIRRMAHFDHRLLNPP